MNSRRQDSNESAPHKVPAHRNPPARPERARLACSSARLGSGGRRFAFGGAPHDERDERKHPGYEDRGDGACMERHVTPDGIGDAGRLRRRCSRDGS